MNLQDLRDLLDKHLIYRPAVRINNEGDPMPEYFAIERYGNIWKVYYQEKGRVGYEQVFGNEQAACVYLLGLLYLTKALTANT